MKRLLSSPWVLVALVVVAVAVAAVYARRRQASAAADEFRPSESLLKEARSYGQVAPGQKNR
jgi:hypothetical protein